MDEHQGNSEENLYIEENNLYYKYLLENYSVLQIE